ncbi:MAG: DNA-binding protein [Gammaproteobacteria bacterium]|nr:DNA-binding protein [Gammaproteobacteria bacterium]MCD8542688.1 DNA-binding protein [Gammaproteobacteria bacterium]MCD8573655.1 DNA-binding protein [Gammaproteobacteria bacterium]
MGRNGVTFHDIAETVPKLIEQRKTPSIDNIREYLGTGSKSTIAKLLREWKAQQGLRPEDDSHLPPDLTELVKLLWDRLRQKADNQIANERQEFDAKIMETQRQYHQEHKLHKDLQQNHHALEERLHQQMEENKQLRATLIIEQQEKV